jgi:SAM-dependent methyltransferase
VCGIDRSPELIAVARNREVTGADLPEFAIGDLLKLSFARPFDVVLCRGVLNDFVVDASRSSIFRQFAIWLRPGGILIFDVREWTRTLARYTKNSLHRRTVELANGVLHFQSETVLDNGSRRLLIRERFEMDREGGRIATENDFAMRAWTLEETAACLQAVGLEEIATYPTYGETDRAWSDRVVVIARKGAGMPPSHAR